MHRWIAVAFATLAAFAASGQTAPGLGDAASFVVLGGSSVTNVGSTRITGNVGVSPGRVIDGLPASAFTLGEKRIDDALARQARIDANAAGDELAARPSTATLDDAQLGGKTLRPGVYCFAADGVVLSDTLILDAEGDRNAVWIFQVRGSLITGPGARVLVVGNGYDGNVFWRIGGEALIGPRTSFIGNLFARTDIEFQSLATLSGRAISRTGRVSLAENRLTLCCAPITVSPPSIPNGTLDTPYRQTFSASGGVAPYTFTVSSGVLPPGPTLDVDGTLHGTPRQVGTFALTISATDSTGCFGTAAYSIDIACGERTVLPEATVRVAYGPVTLFDGESCAVVDGTLPEGLVPAGCVLRGIPVETGTFDFIVENGEGPPRSRCFTLRVSECPIEIVSDPPDGVACVPYAHGLVASGGTAPYTFTSPELSCGLTLALDGTLSGTPPAKGTCTIPVTVTDALLRSCIRTVVIEIACPPSSGEDIELPDGTIGVEYRQTFPPRPCGEPGTYSGDAPPGLVIEGLEISGIPSESGHFTFIVESVTADGCVIAHTVTIDVNPPGDGPVDDDCHRIAITPGEGLPSGIAGAPYPQTIFTASNGTPPYTFEIASGSLPTGLTLSNDGTLSGTPVGAGTSAFSIRVTDANGCLTTHAFCALDVGTSACPPGTAIDVSPPDLPRGEPAVPYAQALAAVGGTAPYAFVVSAGDLPPGLMLTIAGTITGVPAAAGAYSFTVTIRDANGCRGSRCYTLFVGTEIPALSRWALLLLTALVSLTGFVVVSRR